MTVPAWMRRFWMAEIMATKKATPQGHSMWLPDRSTASAYKFFWASIWASPNLSLMLCR